MHILSSLVLRKISSHAHTPWQPICTRIQYVPMKNWVKFYTLSILRTLQELSSSLWVKCKILVVPCVLLLPCLHNHTSCDSPPHAWSSPTIQPSISSWVAGHAFTPQCFPSLCFACLPSGRLCCLPQLLQASYLISFSQWVLHWPPDRSDHECLHPPPTPVLLLSVVFMNI